MTDNQGIDGPLPLARRRLEDAVHALADPAPQWGGGMCRWSDALYDRLRAALLAGRPERGSGQRRSAPCRSTC